MPPSTRSRSKLKDSENPSISSSQSPRKNIRNALDQDSPDNKRNSSPTSASPLTDSSHHPSSHRDRKRKRSQTEATGPRSPPLKRVANSTLKTLRNASEDSYISPPKGHKVSVEIPDSSFCRASRNGRPTSSSNIGKIAFGDFEEYMEKFDYFRKPGDKTPSRRPRPRNASTSASASGELGSPFVTRTKERRSEKPVAVETPSSLRSVRASSLKYRTPHNSPPPSPSVASSSRTRRSVSFKLPSPILDFDRPSSRSPSQHTVDGSQFSDENDDGSVLESDHADQHVHSSHRGETVDRSCSESDGMSTSNEASDDGSINLDRLSPYSAGVLMKKKYRELSQHQDSVFSPRDLLEGRFSKSSPHTPPRKVSLNFSDKPSTLRPVKNKHEKSSPVSTSSRRTSHSEKDRPDNSIKKEVFLEDLNAHYDEPENDECYNVAAVNKYLSKSFWKSLPNLRFYKFWTWSGMVESEQCGFALQELEENNPSANILNVVRVMKFTRSKNFVNFATVSPGIFRIAKKPGRDNRPLNHFACLFSELSSPPPIAIGITVGMVEYSSIYSGTWPHERSQPTGFSPSKSLGLFMPVGIFDRFQSSITYVFRDDLDAEIRALQAQVEAGRAIEFSTRAALPSDSSRQTKMSNYKGVSRSTTMNVRAIEKSPVVSSQVTSLAFSDKVPIYDCRGERKLDLRTERDLPPTRFPLYDQELMKDDVVFIGFTTNTFAKTSSTTNRRLSFNVLWVALLAVGQEQYD